ncbi:MAG: zinc ribbon domain-containing protein [Ruminococcus sp.]|nr:zinc ribbon domain-containing protein [Ruminococcus sp.]
MICRYCGHEVSDGIKFCNNCGANLGAEQPMQDIYSQNAPQPGQNPFSNAQQPNGIPEPNQYGQPQFNGGNLPPNDLPVTVRTEPITVKIKKTNPILVAVVVVIIIGLVVAVFSHINNDVNRVKNGTIDISEYKGTKWGDALDKVCKDQKWKAYKDGSKHMVKYTGVKKSDGKEIEIIFKLSSNRKTFSVESITDDGEKSTNETKIAFTIMQIFNGSL